MAAGRDFSRWVSRTPVINGWKERLTQFVSFKKDINSLEESTALMSRYWFVTWHKPNHIDVFCNKMPYRAKMHIKKKPV